MSTQTETTQAQPAPSFDVVTYREAIIAALRDAMEEDPSVILLGEDVAAPGGPFKTSEGLLDRFGASRVLDTPICENTFVGAALGMAITGLRPVVEIMFSDFLPTAADALVNEVPKLRFMSGGQMSVPLTIRSIGGATGRFGTQHSATGESWFLQVPGLRVATLGSPRAAYGVIRAAIAENNPVLVIEHKGMYALKGPLPENDSTFPVGKAEIVRPGSDVTIVATLLMVERSLRAAEQLAAEGIDAEVIDLRWIAPMDVDAVVESVNRTARLLIVEEQYHAGGWGATLISELTMRGQTWSALPSTVSLLNVPIPFSPFLEDEVVPGVDRIAAAIRSMVVRGEGLETGTTGETR